jgi:hypothetical protein
MRIVSVIRKPFEGSTTQNVLVHHVSCINIDGTTHQTHGAGSNGIYGKYAAIQSNKTRGQELGRWPANLILSYPEGVETLNQQTGLEYNGARFFRNVLL